MCLYVHIDRQEGEKARKMSILPVVGGARTQFASNYEETDTNDRPLVPRVYSRGRHSLTPDGGRRASVLSRDAPQPRLTRLAETRTPNQISRRQRAF